MRCGKRVNTSGNIDKSMKVRKGFSCVMVVITDTAPDEGGYYDAAAAAGDDPNDADCDREDFLYCSHYS